MTQKETIKLIGIITMAYPNFDKFKDENHIRSMVAGRTPQGVRGLKFL